MPSTSLERAIDRLRSLEAKCLRAGSEETSALTLREVAIELSVITAEISREDHRLRMEAEQIAGLLAQVQEGQRGVETLSRRLRELELKREAERV